MPPFVGSKLTAFIFGRLQLCDGSIQGPLFFKGSERMQVSRP
jgi:hypothetical protein